MNKIAGTNNMEIIKAREEHTDTLLAFAKDNFKRTYAHLNTPENMEHYLETSFSAESFQKEFQNPESNFFIVHHEETIAGYYKSNLGAAQTEDQYPNSLEIERIYVTPTLKGQGIGKQMIDHAKNYALQIHLDYIWLGVWEKNEKALGFYKKMGFNPIDTHIFQLGEDAQTDYIMKLTL